VRRSSTPFSAVLRAGLVSFRCAGSAPRFVCRRRRACVRTPTFRYSPVFCICTRFLSLRRVSSSAMMTVFGFRACDPTRFRLPPSLLARAVRFVPPTLVFATVLRLSCRRAVPFSMLFLRRVLTPVLPVSGAGLVVLPAVELAREGRSMLNRRAVPGTHQPCPGRRRDAPAMPCPAARRGGAVAPIRLHDPLDPAV
jgi:hypothetical protein